MSESALEIAREAVENQLKVKEFIDDFKDTIYDKLEQREAHVTETEEDRGDLQRAGNATFIAEGLALMSGVVTIGSTRENFDKASKWIKTLFPKAEPTPVFLALTLIYIVNKGKDDAEASGDDKQIEKWKRIHGRLEAFAPPMQKTT